ncbi:ABC transporter substrate-binding protein [Pseudoroseomonas wenyumeiae]|uniref:ABC transporter substrate-binding protein n=1 Tax=Teichococcus wenyumeiae TaxID=2478470 RepID=A0ABX9VD65_9PROT|nr:ABC transporter substrate-binding protein [Pseudoroseomonas wenyumeiae]RMI15237.1 ABC transporter substrate-binding protein [Pseudoroseomonas wenyumeiae]
MPDNSRLLIPNRRRFLTLSGAALAAPWIIAGPARAAGQVIVRTPGGAYDDVMRRHVYEPFTKETGITVMPVAATVAKLMAMFRANNVELDLIDTGDGPLVTLGRAGALEPIDYGSWKWSKPEDVAPEYRHELRVANFVYASVLAYNKESFPDGKNPKSWAEFWDAGKFPGPRMLADMASSSPDLEFALLADGVPRDQIYPMDLDRAFKSLSRIRPNIRKFWDTGALSAQMLSDKEVVLGSIWNGRLQTLIDKGAPLGFEWAENMIQVQSLSIFKGSPNKANAQKLVDFMMQPSVQAKYSKDLEYGPTNLKAFDMLPPEQVQRMPGSPAARQGGFMRNVEWLEANRDKVNRAWSRWILG